jgi:hypothetical protein
MNRETPGPLLTLGQSHYNSTASTSLTKRPLSPLKKAATIWNLASLNPPMFRMSSRCGAKELNKAAGKIVADHGGYRDLVLAVIEVDTFLL